MRATATTGWAILAGWIALAGSVSTTKADLIRLRGGGEIRGVILPDATQAERIRIQTESGARPLTLDRWQVLEVVAENDPLDAYFAKRDTTPETAAAQYELGVWCEERKLRGLAEAHYRRTIELDPGHEAAQRKLGHVLHEGVWMTYDAVKLSQGLVHYRGRWISQEEYERETAKASRDAEDASRVRQLIPLRMNLKSANAEVFESAERALEGFRDPASVSALVEVFGQDDMDGRIRLARLLGGIPGVEARQALVERVLREPDATVLVVLVDELAHRKEPEATQALLRALADRDRTRVGRAARALGHLGVLEAVPRLVSVLVKVDQKPVFVRSRSAPPLIGPGVGSLGAGVYGGPSWSGMAGPAMGSGASGFSTAGDGTSLWLRGGGPGHKPAIRMLTRVDRSSDVHEALVALTGQDFGYDTAAWRQWLKQNPTRTTGPPSKRIPQP